MKGEGGKVCMSGGREGEGGGSLFVALKIVARTNNNALFIVLT